MSIIFSAICLVLSLPVTAWGTVWVETCLSSTGRDYPFPGGGGECHSLCYGPVIDTSPALWLISSIKHKNPPPHARPDVQHLYPHLRPGEAGSSWVRSRSNYMNQTERRINQRRPGTGPGWEGARCEGCLFEWQSPGSANGLADLPAGGPGWVLCPLQTVKLIYDQNFIVRIRAELRVAGQD